MRPLEANPCPCIPKFANLRCELRHNVIFRTDPELQLRVSVMHAAFREPAHGILANIPADFSTSTMRPSLFGRRGIVREKLFNECAVGFRSLARRASSPRP